MFVTLAPGCVDRLNHRIRVASNRTGGELRDKDFGLFLKISLFELGKG